MINPILIGLELLTFQFVSRPGGVIFPEHDFNGSDVIRSDTFAEGCRHDPRKMFNGWVQACKLWLVIQHLFPVIGYDLIQMLFDLYNIHQVTVWVEFAS